ncbi:2-oxo-4-hydroxy-4-carboxy-5-ureidoimidazoline decarboxylase [Frondihabitans cladoniiphilus]|uniref:2-oxo-4-hydroxy-4-carboxy-5-ureidoimidazoline decarboxylase n=1 Tax=Frondihabitans cladoniiphilus TaxID=715785 RepID=A0ABP8WBG0_9MICO
MIDVTDSDLREGLAASLHVQRWVDEVASAAPFDSFESLRQKSHDAATPLSPEEIDEALASHPRIGERPVGQGQAQAFSTAEQQAPDVEDQHLAKALAEGNATYEKRFGRVFLIRAAGRSRAEIVAELDRRLVLDDASELELVGQELRDIALLRLEKLYGPAAAAGVAGVSETGASA